MQISVRLYKALKYLDLINEDGSLKYEECAKVPYIEFLRIPNFGQKSFNELKYLLSQRGISIVTMNQTGYQRYDYSKPIQPEGKLKRNVEIYHLRKAGWTYRKIADKYDIGPQRVSDICDMMERLKRHPHMRIIGFHDMEAA